MVVTFRVDTTGVVQQLNSIATGLSPAVKAGRRKAAEDGINDAKRIVHVRTGALQRSIGILGETEDTTSYGSDLDYAYDEEFGNSRRPAHPYLTPRANALRSGIAVNYVSQEVSRNL